jgi:hypothetical protein
MAEVLQSNGLVLYLKQGGGTLYPIACAKNSTITIDREVIELAPKTSSTYRQYIKGRSEFTISGNGLIKVNEANINTITFFDSFIKGTDVICDGRFDMIDPQGNYKKYSFQAFLTQLTLESTIGQFPSYSFSMQGVGGFTEVL